MHHFRRLAVSQRPPGADITHADALGRRSVEDGHGVFGERDGPTAQVLRAEVLKTRTADVPALVRPYLTRYGQEAC